MTKDEKVLKLLKYAKSAKKNWTNQKPPLEVTWPQWRLLIGPNFFIADLAYLSNSKTFLPLVKFWSGHYFNIFFPENLLLDLYQPIFFVSLVETFHNDDFWRENFWYWCTKLVTVLKIPILICLFLIGGGHQVNDQYGPATGKARAFRNGITLDGRP